MTFNTAISGLRAASDILQVTGNNIANASTSGFKASRAEFSDVYATSVLGTGGNSIGSGVRLSDVSQQFTQGNTSFTSNSLDMAVNGNGFFILSDSGAMSYGRNGAFHLDNEGFLVDSSGREIQGFLASDSGEISGNLSTLQIVTDNLSPRQTTNVNSMLNLNAELVPPTVRGTTTVATGTAINTPVLGSAFAGGNGYPVETFTFTDVNGVNTVLSTNANDSASDVASLFSTIDGVTVASSNAVTVDMGTAAQVAANTMQVNLNGVSFPVGSTPQQIAIAINNETNNLLQGITANFTGAVPGTGLTISANSGVDLSFTVNGGGTANDVFTMTGDGGSLALGAGAGIQGVIGGKVDLTLAEGITMTSGDLINSTASPNAGTIFADPVVQTPFVANQFDPSNPDTYNDATSLNVFDSLGNSHVMSTYFVKESTINTWSMYVQIDDRDVGDPNPALPSPQNVLPTRAQFSLVFNTDGSLNKTASDDVFISNWTPLNQDGVYNGSQRGLTVANGGALPIPEPPNSSNFVIDLNGTTQFGSPFSVNAVSQNGFTTGRLSGLDVNSEGIIFARYTNGQAQVLGQVALANFNNTQGLQPLGDTLWGETFESGQAIIGTPGSAALGVIQAGALEESNVDLSQELVQLIIAQRNFQANAKTIQTADTVTQTIINLR
jgi:flagellar hook protein FlgE